MTTMQSTRKSLVTAMAANCAAAAGRGMATGFAERKLFAPKMLSEGSGQPVCVRPTKIGNAVAAVVTRANELRTDLAIVAARGDGFLADWFTRHRNDQLVRASSRPVLLLNSEPKEVYRRILVAIDFSEESRQAARIALRISPAAQITFLHAFHVMDEEAMRKAGISNDAINSHRIRAGEAAKTELNRFVDDFGATRQLVSRVVHHGLPSSVICNYAERMRADLIAIGKHKKSCFEELLLGSVTRRFIDQTSCDLLVAPAPAE